MRQSMLQLFMLINLTCLSFIGLAQAADEDLPVNITSDTLLSQEKAGKSTYKGNVIVTQGSMTLKGDVINVNHPDGKLILVIATGKQANFKRFNKTDQAWLKGKADRIEYHAANKTVLLIGNAQAEQLGKHIITGPKLFYDMDKQTLEAQSTETEKQRISVTFTPAKNSEKQ